MIVRHALLALLSEGPKYGFQLAEEFEAGTGEMWPLNTGQVYTTLQRLERDAARRVRRHRRRAAEQLPHHRIGSRRARRMAADAARHVAASARRARDQGARRVAHPRSRRHRAHPAISAAHGGSDARLHRVEGGRGDDDVGLLLVADAEIYRLDSVIRWLDAAEARIRRLPAPSERIAIQPRTISRRRTGARR